MILVYIFLRENIVYRFVVLFAATIKCQSNIEYKILNITKDNSSIQLYSI